MPFYSTPHHQALFSLVPLNDRAQEVVTCPQNHHLTSVLDDGTLVLDIGYNVRSKMRYTLATLGRGFDADIFVDGPTISKIQCSFEVHPTSKAVMLYDRSHSMTTQVFGDKCTPFIPGKPRRIFVGDEINNEFGMGGAGCSLVRFRLEWHRSNREVEAHLEAMDDLFYSQENRRRARTLLPFEALPWNRRPNSPIKVTTEEQRRADWRRHQLLERRRASLPKKQFLDQVHEEETRIQKKRDAEKEAFRNRMLNAYKQLKSGVAGQLAIDEAQHSKPTEPKESANAIACETIKKDWVEQGIWKAEWDDMLKGRYHNIGLWRHEGQHDIDTESEPDTPNPLSLFESFASPRQPRRSDEEKKRIAEERAEKARTREASRPCNQFMYQVSKERERLQNEHRPDGDDEADDHNGRAYENVKALWVKRGIWYSKWGTLPGMEWKHELPLDEDEQVQLQTPPAYVNLRAAPKGSPLFPALEIQASSPGEEGRTPVTFQSLFGDYTTFPISPPIFGDDDVTSRQEQSGNMTRSENRDTTLKRPSIFGDNRTVRFDSVQETTGTETPPNKDKQLSPKLSSSSLGPVHSSGVSKPAAKKHLRSKRTKSRGIKTTDKDNSSRKRTRDDDEFTRPNASRLLSSFFVEGELDS